MDIILSFPFSGSLYAFFTEQETGKKLPKIIGHQYYQTLYGKRHSEVRDLALTFLLLYEDVFVIPADNHMPETQKYSSGGNYKNTELGLYTSWEGHLELRGEIEDQINKDLEDPLISKILATVPPYPKKQILLDSRYEIALANKFNCPILCAGGRSAIIKRLSEIDTSNSSAIQAKKVLINATEAYIDIVSLCFNPTNYELLYSYKKDAEIRAYSNSFKNLISKIDSSKHIKNQMLLLMRESIEKQKLMKKSSGILDIASILLSIAGFIPVIGPFLSGGGLAATAGSKALEKEASRRWYELGPKIRRITESEMIAQKIKQELENN